MLSCDHPEQKSLKIKQDGKFCCRLLSKESSNANPSFRVYYGGASGSVPFLWESQPGTPKNAIPSTPPPPLTPPPSYFSPKKGAGNKSSKTKLLSTILHRLTLIREIRSATPSTSSSLSSSSVSSTSSTFSPIGSLYSRGRRNRFSSPRSSFSSTGGDIDEDSDDGSPTSTLCFGVGNGYRRCNKMVIVKNALSSIVGRGTRHGN